MELTPVNPLPNSETRMSPTHMKLSLPPDYTCSLTTTELVLVSPSRDNHYYELCDWHPLTYSLTTHVCIP